MNERETERELRAWFTRLPAAPASPELRRRVVSIPETTSVPISARLAGALGWQPAPLPRLGLALLLVALAVSLVAGAAIVGSRLLESRPVPPLVPPAVVPTGEPAATPTEPIAAACPVLDEYVAASEELRAIDPWNHRDTTMGALLAAYERFRVAAITAVEGASPSLASALIHSLPSTVEALGAAIASVAATTPPDSVIPTGQLGPVHELILTLAPPNHAHWPCDPDFEEIPSIVMTSSPAGCSPITSAIDRTGDGWTITASRDGDPWVRVEISDVGFRTSYGDGDAASSPAPGWVYLEAEVAYQALADGVLVDARSLPLAEFDQQPDGAVARELSNPAGAPAPPAANEPLRNGETVQGVAVYEVPATGWVGLTGQWLLPESPAPVWRYWTVPFPGGIRYCIYADGSGIDVRTR